MKNHLKELSPVELHKAAFEYADLCPNCDPEGIQCCSECQRLGKYFGYKEGYRKALENDKGRI